jgi:probable LLM family oxidoreductase
MNNPKPAFELGILSFVEFGADPTTGIAISGEQRMAELLETIELADQVGLDVFSIGEHHRPEYLASSPATILAAAAARTKNIRLSSGVTVLSSDDPVRVYQQFATVDLISQGRAEIMAGRGSFIESFPLFGYDLKHYDELFVEKLELLLAIREKEKVTWQGKHRAPINNLGVYPRPVQKPLPVWIAVGGTPESVKRAGTLGLPLMIAIIGGMPESFAQLGELYRFAALHAGHDADALPLGINSHGFIADDSQEAVEIFVPSYARTMNRLGAERGWPPITRQQIENSRALRGSLFLGSPDEVAEKILFQHEVFGHQRFTMQMGIGPIEHSKVMRAIELFGTKVAPVVRAEIAKRNASSNQS